MIRKKFCCGCGEDKALTEFHLNRGKNDGLQVWCKECQNAAVKAREEANRAKWADRDPYAEGE